MATLTAMKSDDLQKNMLSTYFTLRLGVAVLSALFPWILSLVGWFGGGLPLANSMSAYYGESTGFMRNWFVGILWSVGSFLYLYKGYSPLENILLNIAGGSAVVLALVPCNCWNGADGDSNTWHFAAALSFFVAMSCVCLFCAKDTVKLMNEKDQKIYTRTYNVIGLLLFLVPAAAVGVGFLLNQSGRRIFLIEGTAVSIFAWFWFAKTREFKKTSAEKLAVHGKIENVKKLGVRRV